jgi:hypothetical protein
MTYIGKRWLVLRKSKGEPGGKYFQRWQLIEPVSFEYYNNLAPNSATPDLSPFINK